MVVLRTLNAGVKRGGTCCPSSLVPNVARRACGERDEWDQALRVHEKVDRERERDFGIQIKKEAEQRESKTQREAEASEQPPAAAMWPAHPQRMGHPAPPNT